MELTNVYKDIALRTGGDIYVGVVGPVRVGKSTFITKFMEKFVIPNIQNPQVRQRAVDELPQAADGTTIMTTQPKFVPNEAVRVTIAEKATFNVRMVDCVGYMVTGAGGHTEDNKPRMVKTPWQTKAMPFEDAAEFGTKKVVSEHSTVAVLLTADGSFTGINRASYQEAEVRLVKELKEHNKPFVIVLNTVAPNAPESKSLANNLAELYGVKVMAVNVLELETADIDNVFANVLSEFPLVGVEVNLPAYLQALEFNNPIIQEIVVEIKKAVVGAAKIGDFNKSTVLFESSMRFDPMTISSIDLGAGKIIYDIMPKEDLFYEVLSVQCGTEIKNDFELVALMNELSVARREYNKMKQALLDVNETGYGIVLPAEGDIVLGEPEIVRNGSRFGVRLAATARSLHIMRVDLNTEINPIVGTEQQSHDLAEYLRGEQAIDPKRLWETNMFGKSIAQLMGEGLAGKLNSMPLEAQKKMRKTLTKIVNEGRGGIICILL
ncbi:MAG: stage IV sporulation protein A [Firmicutes bacterium]|nr:stage IV sporulation protein A [Bacillota bacterium]